MPLRTPVLASARVDATRPSDQATSVEAMHPDPRDDVELLYYLTRTCRTGAARYHQYPRNRPAIFPTYFLTIKYQR